MKLECVSQELNNKPKKTDAKGQKHNKKTNKSFLKSTLKVVKKRNVP